MEDVFGLSNYISEHPQAQTLYSDPLFASGILRLFDPRTTQLVFSLISDAIHRSIIERMPEYSHSLKILRKMHLINEKDGIIHLNETFRDSLLSGFSSELKGSFLSICDDGLINYSNPNEAKTDKFQQLLNQIVNKAAERSSKTRNLLLFAGLVDEHGNITNAGFEFLLKNRAEQQWHIVLCAVGFFSREPKDDIVLLSSMIEICMKKHKSIYKTQDWNDWHRFLESIGVLLRLDRSNQVVIFNDDFFSQFSRRKKDSYLVLETNFKIYAYSSQIYDRSILNLFSRAVYVLPDLVKAEFNEISARAIFEKGITAAQIVRYLKDHSTGIPRSVEDQLIIWEGKLNRIKTIKGVLYSDFNHLSDYLQLEKMLGKIGAILYSNENRRIIIAKESAIEEAKKLLKSLVHH